VENTPKGTGLLRQGPNALAQAQKKRCLGKQEIDSWQLAQTDKQCSTNSLNVAQRVFTKQFGPRRFFERLKIDLFYLQTS